MQWLWYLARLRREQNGKGVFNLTSCRIEPVICNFHSENSSALDSDLQICSCCARFFIARDHQVLPRAFSDVELCCIVSAGERVSCSAQRERAPAAHTQNTGIMSHGEKGGGTQKSLGLLSEWGRRERAGNH